MMMMMMIIIIITFIALMEEGRGNVGMEEIA